MDIFLLVLVLSGLITNGLREVPYALRGKTSPRMQARLERAQARRLRAEARLKPKPVKPRKPPGPLRKFLSALWEDSMIDATAARRRRRHRQKHRRIHGRLWRQYAGRGVRRAGRWSAYGVGVVWARWSGGPMPDKPAPVAHIPDVPMSDTPGSSSAAGAAAGSTPPHGSAGATAGATDPPPRAAWTHVDGDPTEYRKHTRGKEEPATVYATSERMDHPATPPTADPATPPEPRRIEHGDALVVDGTITNPRPAVTALPAGTDTTKGHTTMTAEATNLAAAISWAKQTGQEAAKGRADVELFLASLAEGNVTGTAPALASQLGELMSQIAAVSGQLEAELNTHNTVGEAYNIVSGAGDKAFVTGG